VKTFKLYDKGINRLSKSRKAAPLKAESNFDCFLYHTLASFCFKSFSQ
jgi:hypothetical protein